MKNGGPVFPCAGVIPPSIGMSIRDLFALSYALVHGSVSRDGAKIAYEFADAMLAEREK